MEFIDYLQQPWLYAVLSVTYVLSIITVILVILGENRNPVKSLAWVTVLILLPAVGLILYIFFGRNIKNKRMISRRNKRRLRRATRTKGALRRAGSLPEGQQQLAHLAASVDGAVFYPDNRIEIFSDGISKFDALKNDLRNANDYIHLQYYIFEDDEIGKEIAEILKAKAREGVKVRVIYDHVGSIHVRGSFFRKLRKAGVEIYPFFKVAFLPFASKVNWRNHRKIAVIDGKVAYIGGMNIADRYLKGNKRFPLWRDCHLRITGPAISALQYSFAFDWKFMGRDLIEDSAESVAVEPTAGVQLVTGGPMSRWNAIACVYLHAISSAQKRVWLQTPYYLPPEAILKALQNVALSGVDVRVMLPRHSDSAMLSYASHSYITESLRAGVKIYFFDAGMLHSKVLIIDDDIASVGSANCDFRSFEHNFEANLLIYSKDVNKRLREQFLADQTQSSRVISSKWKNRPRFHRAAESVVRLLSPIL